MKLDLNEIWEFMEMAPEPYAGSKGVQWSYELVVGEIIVKDLKTSDIESLKNSDYYDTELLPSIFTFREILWQPNVYANPQLCIPQLNILKVFCEEFEAEFSQKEGLKSWPFFVLLQGVSKFCQEAIDKLVEIGEGSQVHDIAKVLGELRRKTFPIVEFFLFHPCNRIDYQKDAVNRLNYAVKIMLTQYNNKFFELSDPYWNITTSKTAKKKIADAIAEANTEA
ncbi:hypothetical protein [Reichenbachiella versicolor]|uniref:hypothetical protein n=1 Tax=Reichenbachiella versicolor TaxID=1821036 RepID=UPI000D6E752C|nr:hypothetical protein [Reichenbachiella versicolor]